MPRTLKELKSIIYREEYEDRSEWEKIDQEVEEAWEVASEEEREAFMDSGAGDMIGQILAYME